MNGFLDRMRRSSEARVAAARAGESLSSLRSRALATRAPSPLVAHASGFDLIAESKLAAPSSGVLARPDDPDAFVADRARAYASGGAAAVSVLTEPDWFHGGLSHLAAAARAVAVPVMRKDFVVDVRQVFEARAHGASGVLLIVRLVDAARLRELFDAAREAGLFVLVEAFDAADLEVAVRLASSARDSRLLVGVNARDLDTLEIDAARLAALETLARALPLETPRVAESGLASPADAARVASRGWSFVLVGTALMRAADPAAEVARLVAAGRGAAAGSKLSR